MPERSFVGFIAETGRRPPVWARGLAAALLVHLLALGAVMTPATTPAAVPEPQTIAMIIEPEATAAPSPEVPPVEPAAVAAEPVPPADAAPASPEPPAPPGPSPQLAAPEANSAAPLPPTPPPAPRQRPPPLHKAARQGDRSPQTAPPGSGAQPSVAASAAVPAAPATEPPSPAPVVSLADPSGAWRGALAAWLQGHKTYPDAARRDGVEGRAVVKFTMDASGAVLAVALASSSGSPLLDDAALAMLRSARLPPPPPGGPGTISITLPVRYSLQR